MQIEDYEDAAEHAAWLQTTVRTLRRWVDEPDGLPFTTRGQTRLLKRSWTLEWLEGRRMPRNPSKRGRRAA